MRISGNKLDNGKNIAGIKFSRLLAIKCIKRVKDKPYWLFKCDCGKDVIASKYHAMAGEARSCGCFREDQNKKRLTTHGMQRTRLYKIWCGLKSICLLTSHPKYPRYGGRGISVCEKWLSFEGFKDDMYESYKKHCKEKGEKNTTIDRIDNDGNYCKENCRWATWDDQSRNRGVLIKHNNIVKNMAGWDEFLSVSKGTTKKNIYAGYSIEQIIKKYE